MIDDVIINEITAVRIMIYEIRERNPDAVKFVVTPTEVKTILFFLKIKKYDTLMYLYGHQFLIEIMKTFEAVENYEECVEIVKQIQAHNNYFKENIPTFLNIKNK